MKSGVQNQVDMNKLCLVKADLFCDVFDKNKNNPGKTKFYENNMVHAFEV